MSIEWKLSILSMHITDTLADTLKEFDQPYKIITKISYSWFDVQLCFL